MRLLFWILRILAVLLLLRMLLHYFFRPRRSGAGPSGSRGPAKSPERLGGELVRDPNCGTYVPKSHALISGSGDGALYFCSATCRDAYAQNAGVKQ